MAWSPSPSQKKWLLVEAVMKQQARRSKRFIDPKDIAKYANALIKSDPFYSSVGNLTAGQARSLCTTWVGAGFVQERKGTTVRKDPMLAYPKGTKGTLSFRWIGGRRSASIPGHPDRGETYHKKQIREFRRSLR